MWALGIEIEVKGMRVSDPQDDCQLCGESTSPGSGKWVNRLGFDEGWACAECLSMECDRCEEMIALDEDMCVPSGCRVHETCLTEEEIAFGETQEEFPQDEDGWKGFGAFIGCTHDMFDSSSLYDRDRGVRILVCKTCEHFERTVMPSDVVRER